MTPAECGPLVFRMPSHTTPTTRKPETRSAQNRPSRPSRQESNPMAECAQVCAETLNYCLTQGGQHVEASHIKGLLDCVDICELNSRYHSRESEFKHQVMAVCAQVCRSCETSCAQFEDDEQMQACAEACRKCAEHCEG
jgi:hypothetical protein